MRNTKIEWADHTFNPWIGCTKISPGCDNCYAETLMDKRMHVVNWGAGQPRKLTSESNWNQVKKWDHDARAAGKRVRVFCASLADVFDNEAHQVWLINLASLISITTNIDWLLLTKRIGNVMPMCRHDSLLFDVLQEKVWLGITVVNQEEADRDIPKLLAVPAHKRFLSIEPMLEPIDIIPYVGGRAIQCGCGFRRNDYGLMGAMIENEVCSDCYKKTTTWPTVDWVIAGGESGPKARPSHPNWFRSLRDQCAATRVPFLFKQWGEWAPREQYNSELMESDELSGKWDGTMFKYGKTEAGRILDGRTHDEFPQMRV